MFFASDNGGPVHPAILEAISAANDGFAMGYGNDDLSRTAVAMVREVFEAPEATVLLVATGTAANSILLGALADPWQATYCSPLAHILVDECNAPVFYTGGAALVPVESPNARIDAGALDRAMAAQERRGIHGAQRGPVSITQVTEMGTVYGLDEIAAIAEVTHRHGQKLHMDGARFANACAALGCSPAEMTWKAGVDAVSFGGTKNGCMGVEAAILFDPRQDLELQLRRKRGGHLFSKHRYLAAQMSGYLEGGLWLDLAARANAQTARLAEGVRRHAAVELVEEPAANMIFARMPRALHQRLKAAGAVYYVEDGDVASGPAEERLTGRLVCDWSVGAAAVDAFLQALHA